MPGYTNPAFLPVKKTFTLNVSQVAATYTAATATGDVAVLSAVVSVGATSAAGLISLAVSDNDSAPAILSAAEGAVANLTANTVVKTFSTSFILHSTKVIQYTIVGTGTGGVVTVAITYMPLSLTAGLA